MRDEPFIDTAGRSLLRSGKFTRSERVIRRLLVGFFPFSFRISRPHLFSFVSQDVSLKATELGQQSTKRLCRCSSISQ